MSLRIAAAAFAIAFCGTAAPAAPLTVPFNFSRGVIELDVAVKRVPLHMLLDTGVDPSVIDLARAEALGLRIDRGSGGEVSGVGSATHAEGYDAEIDGLEIGGRSFSAIDAGATNLEAVSSAYGRPLGGMLGYSFLKEKIVLIDYAAKRVSILDRVSDAVAATKRCARHASMSMRFLKDENWPLVADFHVGAAVVPVTLDTGSNDTLSLYQGALDLEGVRTVLRKESAATSTGLRGSAPLVTYKIDAPLGFGPLVLPAGEKATLRDEKGSATTRFGNVGNTLLASLTPVMLLDYRDREMTFYGGCR
ncbi:MAG TPA: aspartyl protease family protein [Rhizomicrobium sp.]|jgi:hypothetical protein